MLFENQKRDGRNVPVFGRDGQIMPIFGRDGQIIPIFGRDGQIIPIFGRDDRIIKRAPRPAGRTTKYKTLEYTERLEFQAAENVQSVFQG